MEERRSQLRGWTRNRLIVFDRNTDEVIGYVANMCVEGLMVMCEESAGMSSLIACRVALPQRHLNRDQLFFDAEVRWCRETDTAGIHEIGMKFTRIDEVDRKIIVKILEDCTVAATGPQDALEFSS